MQTQFYKDQTFVLIFANHLSPSINRRIQSLRVRDKEIIVILKREKRKRDTSDDEHSLKDNFVLLSNYIVEIIFLD